MKKNISTPKKENGGLERPPIVVVMGHIDHGKTTLLDFIRKTKVAEKEIGGITQHIGAYEAEHGGKKITFIDTPGHEAFTAMRARGARVADIAVLVVSAEDGVKQQTKEAITIIKEAGIPFVVAINKVDKTNADTPRTKKDLAGNDVLIEEYGGKIPAVEISAKNGQNVDSLLDTILLVAEFEELVWHPERPAFGVVIESHTDPKRGKSATLLLQDGTMRLGQFLVIRDAVAPIRIFENFHGRPLNEATAAMPAVIYNLVGDAPLGEEFQVFDSKTEAEGYADQRKAVEKIMPAEDTEGHTVPVLNIILKADVLGSKEAIESLLVRLQFARVRNRILRSETGDVNESDVKIAASGKHVMIVGFRVKVLPVFQELASAQGVTIIFRDIIYDLEDDIKNEMIKLVPAEMRRADLGRAKILALFKKEKNKQIIGGRALEGTFKKGALFEIERNKTKIGSGKILSLQQLKRDVEEVGEGTEFGMLVEAGISIAEGDILFIFKEERFAPSLE